LSAGVLLLATACSRPHTNSTSTSGAAGLHVFEGTWTAAGSRQKLDLGSDREASIANFGGTLLLSGASRPDLGFRANAIVLDDSVTGLVGRAAWTDQRGDQIFSELRREGRTGTAISGTFIGGTGRYTGASGTYQFSWRFLLETEDGTLQGQSQGFKGEVRLER
jgi:hypothetical protein